MPVMVGATDNEAGMTKAQREVKLRTRVPAGISTDTPSWKQGVGAMLNIKIVTWSLGLFAAISFVLCVIFGLIVPSSLHMAPFLEAVLPAFKWLTLGGFFLGLIESFLYGVYAGLVYVPIHNWLTRRSGRPQP